ncbi:hypothetical protein CSKR_100302 [Clonorchis sinensis]|uniref:Uncharacterized protein n=1 Tax=Clonorchis sinensis TaxID=79923 RepID=A0A419PDR0_CLOSI|nr:hypothetical protein CSKR_100302 [Clonorchis sinensis]
MVVLKFRVDGSEVAPEYRQHVTGISNSTQAFQAPIRLVIVASFHRAPIHGLHSIVGPSPIFCSSALAARRIVQANYLEELRSYTIT